MELTLGNLQNTDSTVTAVETALENSLSDSVLGDSVTLSVVPAAQTDMVSLNTGTCV